MLRHLRFFSRYRGGALLLLWMIVTAATVIAAPISGSFQVDLVMHPVTCGVDNDGDTFVDEDPVNGIDDDQDGKIDEDPCFKVDDTVLKFEADLVLNLTVSGLQIGSTTVFTFKGVEYQAFSLATAIGALSIHDLFIFAPSLVEIEQVHTNSTLKIRYCVRSSAPLSVTPPFISCPTPDNLLYQLLEDAELFHPAVANLRLAQIFDAAGMLDPVLVFRKKVVDLSLYLAGMVFSSRALFVNVGDVAAPSFRTGLVFAVEGQTVGGIVVRGDFWIGARQGLECFGECKPAERLYGGIVVDSFTTQQETLTIRNLTVAGVTFNLRTEFNFFTDADPDTYCPTQGICYVEIINSGRIAPFGLSLENTLRLDGALNPRFDFLRANLKFGDASATLIWYSYVFDTNSWKSQLLELITSFDPNGVTFTSDLIVCIDQFPLCIPPSAVYEHHVSVSATLGNISWEARFIFLGLFTDFYQVAVDASWRIGQAIFKSSVIFASRSMDALSISSRIEF